MEFTAFVTAVEAILRTEHEVKLNHASPVDDRIEWLIGALTIHLESTSFETVTISATLEDAMIVPTSYPMTFRSARDVAHDLAALVDLPVADK